MPKWNWIGSALLLATLGTSAISAQTLISSLPLEQALKASHRSEKNKARDLYRHPVETLQFFGLKPEMKVVELWAGGGWYTEILAPYLADKGQLITTFYDPNSPNKDIASYGKRFTDKLAANPAVFGKVQFIPMNPPDQLSLGAANSVDMVLTFRNIHNWMEGNYEEKVYQAAYAVLKPGGVFGIEEHRAKPGTSRKASIGTGYVTEESVIAAVEKVGFKLVGKSEINANPKDTKDYKAGVWTLPPTFALKDQDKEKYQSIGESDRMTLKFVK